MNKDEFIRKNSKLEISIGNNERSDITSKAIIILGNIDGFLSLMDILIMSINELEDQIVISDLPFICNKLNKKFVIEIVDIPINNDFGVTNENSDEIRWTIHDYGIIHFATSLHGFQYQSWNHLHFDPRKKESKYSVCCYLK